MVGYGGSDLLCATASRRRRRLVGDTDLLMEADAVFLAASFLDFGFDEVCFRPSPPGDTDDEAAERMRSSMSVDRLDELPVF